MFSVFSVLLVAVFTVLVLHAVFWIIRLAVRYGVNDALRMNRGWLAGRVEERADR